ncbi:hypothetical protein PQX77_006941 [Marasmius sp. AFHP31]|nr:hypothetical protein PQX77_006941 [Marasmius sp. AFHP31]
MSSDKASSIDKAGDVVPGTTGKVVLTDTEVGTVVQSKGVTRMEAISRFSLTSQTTRWAIFLSVFICAWVYILDQSTLLSYQPLVTSYFEQHSSGLATLNIASSVIGSVIKPFIAKISDITSRPYTYLIVLVLYVLGIVVAAASRSITAFIVGSVFITIGQNGLTLLNNIIIADLTPLEWRGLAHGILAAPYIVNVWYAGKIVAALSQGELWRWGYGMFAIIMPVCIAPAILTLINLDRKARKEGVANVASSGATQRDADEKEASVAEVPVDVPPKSRWEMTKGFLEEIDAFGLIILGFGWSLLLLPFSLQKYAQDGWKNPSLIAMMTVGGLLVIAYVPYEFYFARFPSAPRRLIVNRTFITAVIIDFFWLLCGQFTDMYWSSYVFVSKDWSITQWTYYNNILTIALCGGGVVAGLYMRWTHRYKNLQILGQVLKLIGLGIRFDGKKATRSTAVMIASPLIIGIGGSFSVVGSQVSAQASVPHQDVALTISLLGLWSSIGGSIGAAITIAIWGSHLPNLFAQHLPAGTPADTITSFYNSITAIREAPYGSALREGAIEAWREAQWVLFVAGFTMAFIPLVAAMLQKNYWLGKQQNAVTNTSPDGRRLGAEETHEHEKPRSKMEGYMKWWKY